MNIKLIAVDLDGTLLTTAHTLAPQGAAALQRAAQAGIQVVIATTRNLESARPHYQAMGLNGPLICTNGAHVLATPAGACWAYHAIDRRVALALAEMADQEGWELGITVNGMNYVRQRPDQSLGLIAPNLYVVATNTAAVVGNPIRILAWNPDAIMTLHRLCATTFAQACRTEIYYHADGTLNSLGIFAPQANKGTALNLVLDRLQIAPEGVVTIGDNPNDVSMFACGGISVAMGNAPDEVKQQASRIAPSNDAEGVAWALTSLQLA